MDVNALYRLWLEKAAGHPALREELEAIRGDDAAIEDRFYRELAPADCAACSAQARTA